MKTSLTNEHSYNWWRFAEGVLQVVLLTFSYFFKWSVKENCSRTILLAKWETFLYKNNYHFNSFRLMYNFAFITFFVYSWTQWTFVKKFYIFLIVYSLMILERYKQNSRSNIINEGPHKKENNWITSCSCKQPVKNIYFHLILLSYFVSVLSNLLDNVIVRNWSGMHFEFKCKNPRDYLTVFRCDMKIKESGEIPLSHFSRLWNCLIFQDTSVNQWRRRFGIS